VTYADAAAPTTNVGEQTWEATERSSSTGKSVPLASSPTVTLLSADGSGHASVNAPAAPNGGRHLSLMFTYSPALGGLERGAVALKVPSGWSAPSMSAHAPGYVSSPDGRLVVSGRTVVLEVRSLMTGQPISIEYGSTSKGGPGASAPAGRVGDQPWTIAERSSRAGKLKPLAAPPTVTVLSPDGSGELQRATGDVAAGARGATVVFVFVADKGGLLDGELQLVVPQGWSNPSTDAASAGYVTASPGAVRVRGRTISISGLSLRTGEIVTVVYGSRAHGGPGANAPTGVTGPQLWAATERSSAQGRLKALHGR